MKAPLFLLIVVHALTGLHAEPAKPDPTQLTLARIFTDKEFDEEKMPSLKWSKKSASYFTLEKPAEGKDGKDLVQNHVETGQQTILASAKALTPKGEKKPLTVDSFEFNADESKALLFTHTKKVWRKNTRGDYWLLDLATKTLTKLGGDTAPSTLIFAKFYPDGTRVAYVRQNNLHVKTWPISTSPPSPPTAPIPSSTAPPTG